MRSLAWGVEKWRLAAAMLRELSILSQLLPSGTVTMLLVAVRDFQFFPSCCGADEILDGLARDIAAFNSFPVAAAREGQNWGDGGRGAFNSFPVAAEGPVIKPFPPAASLSILSQLLPGHPPPRGAAPPPSTRRFQFFPSCCILCSRRGRSPKVFICLSILSQLLPSP